MGQKTSESKTFLKKKESLVERTAHVMGISPEEADKLLRIPLKHSLRLNPLQGEPQDTLQQLAELGWRGKPVEWCPNGYTIEEGYDAIKNCALVQDGKIYIQNASSWLPVISLDAQPGDHILDTCAAPGGKTSHIAAIINNNGHIVACDSNRGRYLKLQANLKRMGAKVECKLSDGTRGISGVYDKILVDAPCSGEGLVNLDKSNSLDTWSVAHIRRLATTQKQLVLQAWSMLKPGGILVYSTCTMAPEENEAVLEYLLRKASNAKLEPLTVPCSPTIAGWNDRLFPEETGKAGRVFPQDGNEAFFVSKIRKLDA